MIAISPQDLEQNHALLCEYRRACELLGYDPAKAQWSGIRRSVRLPVTHRAGPHRLLLPPIKPRRMRQITHLVVHCTATPKNTTIASIRRHWKEGLGWKAVGYHKIVEPNGNIMTLATDDKVTNGVAGHNATSLHVSYIGGKDTDDRTIQQRQAIARGAAILVTEIPEGPHLWPSGLPWSDEGLPAVQCGERVRLSIPNRQRYAGGVNEKPVINGGLQG
jgi:N-acetylmuramoyl-L-alanine amidase.